MKPERKKIARQTMFKGSRGGTYLLDKIGKGPNRGKTRRRYIKR